MTKEIKLIRKLQNMSYLIQLQQLCLLQKINLEEFPKQHLEHGFSSVQAAWLDNFSIQSVYPQLEQILHCHFHQHLIRLFKIFLAQVGINKND